MMLADLGPSTQVGNTKYPEAKISMCNDGKRSEFSEQKHQLKRQKHTYLHLQLEAYYQIFSHRQTFDLTELI